MISHGNIIFALAQMNVVKQVAPNVTVNSLLINYGDILKSISVHEKN